MQEALTPSLPGPGRDAELRAGLGRADPAAFAIFFERYFPRVLAWAARRRPSAAEAERLAEACLVELLETLDPDPTAAPLAIQLVRAARRATGGRGASAFTK